MNAPEARARIQSHLCLKALLLWVTLVSPALATGKRGIPCNLAGNQQDINACAAREYRAADAALNIRYGNVMVKMPVAERMKLRNNQRDWLKKRALQCKADGRQSEGGSLGMLDYFSCMQTSTEERTRELGRL